MRRSSNLRIIVSSDAGHLGGKADFPSPRRFVRSGSVIAVALESIIVLLAPRRKIPPYSERSKTLKNNPNRPNPRQDAGQLAVLERMTSAGIVAVVRFGRSEPLVDAAEALLAGGVEAIEITLTVPNATRVVEQVADRLGDRILLGAGTVLDPPSARAVILAGAQFIVSPVVRPDVIRLGGRYDIPVIPGALTPTEILAAHQEGADVVKIFPSDVGGPAYLKSLRGPLPQVRLMPTGGVNLDTAAAYLRAGACALGIGGSLVEPTAIEAGDFARIESLARRYVEVVRATRADMSKA